MKAIYRHNYIRLVEVHNDVMCVEELPITITNYKGEKIIVGYKHKMKCNCCGETWVENINSPQITEDKVLIDYKKYFQGWKMMNCTGFKKLKESK